MSKDKDIASKRRGVYAAAHNLGILERGSRDDGLHLLVQALTGKDSISNLDDAELDTLLSNMNSRTAPSHVPVRSSSIVAKGSRATAGMTDGQQRKVWALMYALERVSPSETARGKRLCGIMRKYLGVDATPETPFRWLTYYWGGKLIEAIKGLVDTERRRHDGEDDQ
jgi:hypothetical protein